MDGSEGVARPAPSLLVLFGASGDLTRRLLVPDLFGLFLEGLLPQGFAVLGVSPAHKVHQVAGKLQVTLVACVLCPAEDRLLAHRLDQRAGDL